MSQSLVRAFHQKYGHHISERPTVTLNPDITRLRMDLIFEEHGELKLALDDYLYYSQRGDPRAWDKLVEVADGMADLLYVIFGTAVSLGVPLEECFAEVHRSNMTKSLVRVSPGEKYGPGGGKGADYSPPDLKSILAKASDNKEKL